MSYRRNNTYKVRWYCKGGVVISIKQTLNIPVRYIGVGEGIEDLQEFDAEAFAEALF